VEGSRILAFGEIMQGQGRSWWYAFENSYPSGTLTNLTFISQITENTLCYSFPTSKFYTFETKGVSTIESNQNNCQFYSLNYYFPRPVTFNSITIEYNVAVAANTDIGTLYVRDDLGGSTTVGTVRTTSTTQTRFDMPYPTIISRTLQLRYQALANTPISRFTLFYNEKE
jgi:hypothetical protein